MKWKSLCVLATLPMLVNAPAAWAASDYLLEIDGVAGEASTSVEVLSWSWGASNPGAASTSRLRESPSRPSAGGVRVAAGDVNGDGRADLAVASTMDQVQGFSLTIDGGSPLALHCASGQHIPNARLTHNGAQSYVLENVMVSSCAVGPRQTTSRMGSQTCTASPCTVASTVTMTLTGQLRYVKTGHVTLMK